MAFEKKVTPAAARVGRLTIFVTTDVLKDGTVEPPVFTVTQAEADFSLDLQAQSGQIVDRVNGNLAPHISNTFKNQLVNIITTVRADATTKLIG